MFSPYDFGYGRIALLDSPPFLEAIMKSISKKLAVIALAAVLSVPAFSRGKDFHHGRHFPGQQMKEKVTMGTVIDVNSDAMIITLKDADGKNRKIHVNPLTHIAKIPEFKKPKEMAEPNAEEKKEPKERNFPKFEKLSISELKTGYWISVHRFNADTETIEASFVNVVIPKAE